MKSAHNYNYRSEDGVFFLYDGDEQVLTPEDIPVSTRSEALAERLVADAVKYKGSFTDLRSVLSFHGGTCNVLETLSEEESHEGVIEFCEDIIRQDPYILFLQDAPMRLAYENMFCEKLPKTIDGLPIWCRMIFITYAMNLQTILLPHHILSELFNAEGDPEENKQYFLDQLKEFWEDNGERVDAKRMKEYGEMIDALLFYFSLETV